MLELKTVFAWLSQNCKIFYGSPYLPRREEDLNKVFSAQVYNPARWGIYYITQFWKQYNWEYYGRRR